MNLDQIETAFERAAAEVGKVIVGQRPLVEGLLVALVSGGHVLIEGVPGLGKTLMVRTLAKVLDCEFTRVQFTPDLMPSDVTGHSVYDLNEKRFNFQAGPLFTNLLLADEINRAPAKTQAALLEAMAERQVTVDGTSYLLDRPFLTIATQNPIEQEGTYPLPEAQLDRFMFKLLVDYPEADQEQEILRHYAQGRTSHDPELFGVEPVLSVDSVIGMADAIPKVIVEDTVLAYITDLVRQTRTLPVLETGASPRASVNLLLGARALAACRGRDFTLPDDVKEIAPAVLRHRIRLRPEAEIEGLVADDVINDLLQTVPAPITTEWEE